MTQDMQKTKTDFLIAVSGFNPVAVINKSRYEMSRTGLKVYLNLPGCISASLFVYNQDEFSFEFRTSTALEDEAEHKLLFNKVNEEGGIPKALSELEIIEWEINAGRNQPEFYLIIPLIGNDGVLGLILIMLKTVLPEKEYFFPLCKIHSNNLALMLNNSSLILEINKLKEVTEQRIALKTKDIVQSTRELKLILDSVQAGLILFEESSKLVTNVNLKASELIGMPGDQIIGSKRDENYFTFNNPGISGILLETNEEIFLRKSNGTLVPIIRTTEKITFGSDVFYIDSFIDISERKAMEEELQKAHFELEQRVEERTHELSKTNDELNKEIQNRIKAEEEVIKLYWAVHQSPVAIIITDLKGIVEYVNPRFSIMTDFSFTEIVGCRMNLLKSEDLSPTDYKSLWETISSGSEWRREYRNRKKGGELFWVSSSISPIRNMDGEISNYLSVQEDITEKKIAYEELLAAKEKAESADKLKSSLLANMNHEFRTPLIGILGFSQLVMFEELNKDLLFMIQSINSSGKRLLNTLNGVLTLAEQATITETVELVKINVNDHIPAAIRDYKAQAEAKGLEFNLSLQSENNFVLADIEKFKSVIGYVLDNAVKYTTAGYINIKIEPVNKKGATWLSIKIEDTGIGISEGDQKVIFEAFRQASEGLNRNYEGCGLGLTLAQTAIREMNGEIAVESRPSKGSVFTILLPGV